jgi:hypothetical protein
MLKAATEEQRRHIEEILAPYHIYISWPLNFEDETDYGYEERVDAIYIDGDISFDAMAEIVDYLRKK